MDIYNFIENEEQREYLLNKHYEFTAVEAAYVVCNSNRAINEKHDAIDYIINMHITPSIHFICIFRLNGTASPR